MTELGIADKVAIVTGSTRGIGRAVAALLGENGAHVVINGREDSTVLEVVKELSARTIRAYGAAGDVTDEHFIRDCVKKTIERHGHIDILVNNVGIYDYTPIENITSEHWQRLVDTNLRSAFLFSREVVPHMKRRKTGRIINIASSVGRFGRAYGAHYCATKGGMIAMAQALAKELGPYGITVNTIAPSLVSTDNSLAGARTRNFDLERFQKSVPLQRIAMPKDVAGVALFLASDLASFISGETVMVTGGLTF